MSVSGTSKSRKGATAAKGERQGDRGEIHLTFTLPDILVLAAAGTYIVGYLIINQVVLRLFVLVGTAFYIAYYALAADEPLWTAIWTSVALGVANIIGLCILLAARSRRMLDSDLAELYDSIADFNALPPGDFRAVMRAGRRDRYEDAQVLVHEGRPTERLFFLLRGEATAQKRGFEFRVPPGIFVGEVAYMLGRNASATVTVDAGAEVIVWDFETLKQKSRRPRFKLALEAMISRDLSRKVAEAIAPY